MFDSLDIEKLKALKIRTLLDLALLVPSSYEDTFLSKKIEINKNLIAKATVLQSVVINNRLQVKFFLEDFKKEAPPGLTVVFTHAGTIRAIFVEIFNLPTSQFFNMEVFPLKINLFDFYPDGIAVLKLWNAEIWSLKRLLKR